MRVDHRRPLQTHPAIARLRQFIMWSIIIVVMYGVYVVTTSIPAETAVEQVQEQKRSKFARMIGNSPLAQVFPFFRAYSSVTEGMDTLIMLDEDRETIRALLIQAGIEPTPANINAAAQYFASKSIVLQSAQAQARDNLNRTVNVDRLRQGQQMLMQPQLPPGVAR